MSGTLVIFARFKVGRIVATPRILELLSPKEITCAIARHQACDWGDVSPEHQDANEAALQDGSSIISVYHSAKNVKFWVLTEADRSKTTLLLPEEY